jgi:hypothetical protein
MINADWTIKMNPAQFEAEYKINFKGPGWYYREFKSEIIGRERNVWLLVVPFKREYEKVWASDFSYEELFHVMVWIDINPMDQFRRALEANVYNMGE